MHTGPAIFVQSKDSCLDDSVPSSSERAGTWDQWTTNNGNPTSHMCAPAPQFRFRLTLLPTSKLAQTLNHATSGPQASFAVVPWHLRKTSGLPDSVGFQGEGRESQPKFENLLEAISREKRRRVILDNPWNATGVLLLKQHAGSCWTFHVVSHTHSRTKMGGGTIDLKIRRRGGWAWQTNTTINSRNYHTTITLKEAHLFVLNFLFCLFTSHGFGNEHGEDWRNKRYNNLPA